jgi:hypothetical protein
LKPYALGAEVIPGDSKSKPFANVETLQAFGSTFPDSALLSESIVNKNIMFHAK